ncbi:hypothetical protein [Sinorhizobium fredii]|nr:hypothetical protein [Sinorhizobium fredii]WOS67065.1 hypothetical protein SFGR64A_30160 [Sinorhizobium fredii GR64]
MINNLRAVDPNSQAVHRRAEELGGSTPSCRWNSATNWPRC